ncbi:GatB/YqeY domain-containing protein [Patescibacteria group bacterium]|nr:GatB/YqeY domain-containing protein [Patescibacteria group bacterium]
MKSFKEIDAVFTEALKKKDSLTIDTLRMLKAGLKNKSIELKRELTEEDFVSIVRNEIKKRNESVVAFEQGGRRELADKEKAEIEILQDFLPDEAPVEEVRALAEAAIQNLPEEDRKNFGKAMSAAMKELKGKADGNTVSGIVKEIIER